MILFTELGKVMSLSLSLGSVKLVHGPMVIENRLLLNAYGWHKNALIAWFYL